MTSEFLTPLKQEYLRSAAVMAVLAAMVCFYAARYELATLGVSTGVGWWPPERWGIVQVWRAVRSVPGPKAGSGSGLSCYGSIY
jgi:hypothetical protein